MKNSVTLHVLIPLVLCFICLNLQTVHSQTIVQFETNGLGEFQVTLFDDAAPLSVANFLGYVQRGDYDGTMFHRSQAVATDGIGILQGGGFRPDSSPITTQPPVVNEAGADRLNQAGTIAYARTSDPDSATSQFFFNTTDNPNLDVQNFTVFGEITSGIEVVNQIQAFDTVVATGATQTFNDLPVRDSDADPLLAESNLAVVTRAVVVSPVPEPTTTAILVLGGVIGSTRRRRK